MSELYQTTFIRQRNIEQLFAGVAIVNPIATIQDCGWLKPDVINHTGIKKLWSLMLERISPTMDHQEAVEIATQASIEAGIYVETIDWILMVTNTTIPGAYAQEIARRHYIQEVTQLNNKLAQAIYNYDDVEVRRIVNQMSSQDINAGINMPDGMTVANEFEAIVKAGNRSIETFIPKLDTAVAGLERTTLTMLGARPSMGKTALMLQIARNVAQSGRRVAFFSLEMSAVNLWGRAACPIVNTTWRDVRAGKLDPEQQDKLIEASYSLGMQYEDRLMIFDSPVQSTENIWRTVAQSLPDLVLVDHLELVSDRHESEVHRLGIITQRLKEIAKQNNVAVLCAVQLNRSLEGRQDKRPTLSDMRDSGKIEQNADVVLMMYRDDYYNPPAKPVDRSLTELWVRKFRDGPRNILIQLAFNPKQEWFE